MGRMERTKARLRSTYNKFKAKAFVVRTLEEQKDKSASGFEMHKVLGPFSLVMLGIGCIIGAGVFVLTGVAARKYAGPGVVVSYALSALTAMLTAFCYAEYAAELPVAGGAFNYISMTFGEFAAWVTACDLILEYTLSAAAVAKGFTAYTAALIGVDAHHLRLQASVFTLDLPAAAAVVAMSFILMRSTAESSTFNNLVTGLNVILIIFVLAAGFPFAKAENYTPFTPFGARGIFTGASVVFFSFIGFDTVATAAEEVKNPGRDLPIGIVGSLSICTVLYVLMCLAITGMQNYKEIDLNAPFAVAFNDVGLGWAQRLVAAGALTGIITSLLGALLGQARIYVTLGRQALAPAWLARVHPVRGTPSNATLVTMATAGFLALFIDIELLAELVSIGTLVVFCSVCAGVLFRRYYVHGSGQPLRPVGMRLVGLAVSAIGFSLSYTERAPLWLPIVFLVLWAAITFSFLRLPVRYTPQVFKCPGSPFLPALGMLSTLHLIGSLGWPAYVRWIVWFVLGTTVYLSYGVHRSQAGESSGGARPSDSGLQQCLMTTTGSPAPHASPNPSITLSTSLNTSAAGAGGGLHHHHPLDLTMQMVGGAGAGAGAGQPHHRTGYQLSPAVGGMIVQPAGGMVAMGPLNGAGGVGGGVEGGGVEPAAYGSGVGGHAFAYGRPYGMPVVGRNELEMRVVGPGGQVAGGGGSRQPSHVPPLDGGANGGGVGRGGQDRAGLLGPGAVRSDGMGGGNGVR